ncbi:MAG TPA: MASE3 domain-containing protein [Nitrospirota bacterium]
MRYTSFVKDQKYFLITICACSVYFVVACLTPEINHVFEPGTYLMLHGMIESVSIVIALMSFGITWHSYPQAKNGQNLFLGCAVLAVGLMDILHTLSYQGLPDFITPNTADKAAKFWVFARLAGGVLYAAAAFVAFDKKSSIKPLTLLSLALALPVVSFFLVIFGGGLIPSMFLPGEGLTPLKIGLEYLATALRLAAALLFLRLYFKTSEKHFLLFTGAMTVSIYSELLFTMYKSPYDLFNLAGHIYKLIAFLFIYLVLFATSVKKPYTELAAAKKKLRDYTSSLELKIRERTRDIALKNSELENLNRLKSEFLAICSHDMKSPLQANLILLEGLLEGLEGELSPEQRKVLEGIITNEEELLGLIRNLLDYARKDEARATLNLSEVDACAFLEEWAGTHSMIARKRGINFSSNAKSLEGMKFYFDKFKVSQLLGNLFSNALKFTPNGGDIMILAYPAGKDKWLTVDFFNSGPAIPADRLSAVFDKYTTSGEAEGTGLGLNICKTIAEQHGGAIWAESEEGSGTKFTFTFPSAPRPLPE